MEKMQIKEARREYLAANKTIKNDAVDGFVVLRGVNKVYPNGVQAVFDFNLSIDKNEFIVLVGPSGCGKSTTLRMVAGLEEISSGTLYIDHVLSNHLPPKDRNIAMVFQSYALYPQMSVYDNIAFGLKVKRVPSEEIKRRVFAAAEILGLGPYLDRKPRELSGGQMQRVALGRAIVRDAKVFLMDEPLSNLDAKLRVQMRSEIVKIHNAIGATTIYVTHDQTEAMTMASRIVVMNKGYIQQIGTPEEIYANPSNVFVAAFIGNPPMNIIEVGLDKEAASAGSDSYSLGKKRRELCDAFIAAKVDYLKELLLCLEDSLDQELFAELGLLAKGKGDLDKCIELCNKLAELKKPLSDLYIDLGKSLSSVKGEKLAYLKAVSLDGKKTLEAIKRHLQGLCRKGASSSERVHGKKKEAAPMEEPPHGLKALFAKKSKPKKIEVIDDKALVEESISRYEAYAADPRILLGIRPEDLVLCERGEGDYEVTVTFSELLGSEWLVHFTLFGQEVIAKADNSRSYRIGDCIGVKIKDDRLKMFDCVAGEAIK